MDGGFTRLDDADSDTISSGDRLTPGLVGRDWSGVLGKFSLNLAMIVTDAVKSFQHMYPCFSKDGNPTSWWNLRRGGHRIY